MISLIAATALLVQTPKKLTETITDAAMFKNGYAVVFREMDVPSSGEYVLDQIPIASLGTLWFTTSSNVKLTSVINAETPTSVDVPAASIGDLLKLNVGKRVTLMFMGQEPVTGTLQSASGSILILKNGEQTIVIDRASVVRVLSPDSLTATSPVKGSVRVLRFQVESKGAGKLYMLSLERGMSWAPGYAITLKADKKLELTGKATVINDIEDLKNIEVRFITGFPNIPYAGIPDPMSDANAFMGAINNMPGPGGPRGSGGFGGGRAGEMFRNQAPASIRFDGWAIPGCG